MTHRQTVDATRSSALAVCTCGWRQMTSDTGIAWQIAHRHALAIHPGDDDGTSRRRAADHR
jgi:hypothetical protein